MKHVVIDTSYLLCLFEIFSNPPQHKEVWERFRAAGEAGAVFYLPVPVIFEMCNHIAQIGDGNQRRTLAAKFKDAVLGSRRSGIPWTITPDSSGVLDHWLQSVDLAITEFSQQYASQEIGLTDIAIIHEARKLYQIVQTRPRPHPAVHIWTTDLALKAQEPDAEQNAFTG